VLHPRLCGVIEQAQGELRLAFEHRHQAPFDLAPESLLFGIRTGSQLHGMRPMRLRISV